MAYTYDDFVKAANSAGKLQRFGKEEIEVVKKSPEYGLTMLGFMKDEDEATNDEAKMLAGAAMEQLRKNYGVTATSAGNYDEKRSSGLLEDDGVAGAFQYDADKDPNMAAYRKAYLREGDRATANALAKASAATGGVASSHAVTAAAQAGNYYAAQLADKVPELRAQAYQEYLDREALKQRDLENRRYEEQRADTKKQQEYQNAMELWSYLGYATPEIAGILGVAEGTKHSAAAQQELENRWREEDRALENQRYEDERVESAKQQEYQNAMELWSYLGYATPEIAAILGVPEGTKHSAAAQQELENRWYEDERAASDKQQEYQNALELWSYLGYATPEIAGILGVPEGTKHSAAAQQELENKRYDEQQEAQNAMNQYERNKGQQEVYDSLSKNITTSFNAEMAGSWKADIDEKVKQGLLTEHQAALLKYEIDGKVEKVCQENYDRISKEISGGYTQARAVELSDEILALFEKGLLTEEDADKLLGILEDKEGGPGGPGGPGEDDPTGSPANNSQVSTPWNSKKTGWTLADKQIGGK